MAKSGKTQSKLADLDYSLGGFDWVDRDSTLWPSFAHWLIEKWYDFYKPAFGKPYEALEEAIAKLADELPKYSSREQIALVHAEARKLGLTTTREQVENELERFLTFQPLHQHKAQLDKTSPQYKTRLKKIQHYEALLKASPWCNYFANQEHIFERAGDNLPPMHYPGEGSLQLALRCVLSEFGSFEHGGISPELSRLFAVNRALKQFYEAVEQLPNESSLQSVLKKAKAGLISFSTAIELKIKQCMDKEPDIFTPPLRVRRNQRALYFAVRRCCKIQNGSKKLGGFIVGFFRTDWPRVPAGLEYDPAKHFDLNKGRAVIRKFLGLTENQTTKERKALWRILHAIIFRDELRDALLRLAYDADQKTKSKRNPKAWQRFRNALAAVFEHIFHQPSDEARFRNFIRANYPNMRHTTPKQRQKLFPEGYSGRNDRAKRDLTKTEQMIIAQKCLQLKTPITFDGVGRSSSWASYGRAVTQVLKEIGIQKPKRAARRRKKEAERHNMR
jgi:hypothetical protein